MILEVDLTPQEEARLRAFASKNGSDPATFVKELLMESGLVAPSTRPGISRDSEELLPSPRDQRPIIDEENAAAIAQLKAWLDEEASNDPEEIRKAEEDLAEFKRNINANRAEAGERLVYL